MRPPQAMLRLCQQSPPDAVGRRPWPIPRRHRGPALRNCDLGESSSPKTSVDDEDEVLLLGPHAAQDPEPGPEVVAAAPSQTDTPLAAPETSEGSPPKPSPPPATISADADASSVARVPETQLSEEDPTSPQVARPVPDFSAQAARSLVGVESPRTAEASRDAHRTDGDEGRRGPYGTDAAPGESQVGEQRIVRALGCFVRADALDAPPVARARIHQGQGQDARCYRGRFRGRRALQRGRAQHLQGVELAGCDAVGHEDRRALAVVPELRDEHDSAALARDRATRPITSLGAKARLWERSHTPCRSGAL